jgi:UDP-glucose 4-epimerase
VNDRVLVTGAAGFIGRHLTRRLLEQGHDVVATDLEPPPEFVMGVADENLDYRRGDVTDASFVDDLLAGEYDRVFHLAAIVGVDQYVETPLKTMEVNVIGTKRLLEGFVGTDTRFVFASTSEIYGKNPDVPWHEDNDRLLGPPIKHRWSYSTSKSACEHMINALMESGEITATVIRPFNVYGPEQRPDFVLSAFVKEAVTGGTLQVFGDGTQTRSPTFIEDFLDGILMASTHPEGENEVFNIGGTREVQINDLAELVLDIADVDGDPKHIPVEEVYDDGYEDLNRRVPEVSRAKEKIDWEATTSLEAGVETTINWAREQYR